MDKGTDNNFFDVCRLCLELNTKMDMTSIKELGDLVFKILPDLNLQLSLNPQICNACSKVIITSYNFCCRTMANQDIITDFLTSRHLKYVNLKDMIRGRAETSLSRASQQFYDVYQPEAVETVVVEDDYCKQENCATMEQNFDISDVYNKDVELYAEEVSEDDIKCTIQENKVVSTSSNYEDVSILPPALNWYPGEVQRKDISVSNSPKPKSSPEKQSCFEAPQGHLRDFDLKELLTNTPYGQNILHFYEQKKTLSNTLRNKLVTIITTHIHSYIMKHVLTRQQYNLLTSKITDIFPNEAAQTYYHLAPIPDKNANRAVGKLVFKVRNLRQLNAESVAGIRIRDKGKHGATRETTKDEANDITWLKNNTQPWSEVLSKWENTFNFRQETSLPTVEEFLNEVPALRTSQLEPMIQSDFDKIYPGKNRLSIQSWCSFFEVILHHQNQTYVIPTLKEDLELLKLDGLSEDVKVAIQLSLLPRLVAPRGRVGGGKKMWKFSTQDSIESLIIFCATPDEINPLIDKQIEKIEKRNLNIELKPYIIIEGDKTNIKNVYVIKDKIRYTCQSVLKAIEFLFMVFTVLKIRYPAQSEHIWQLIEAGVFGIHDRMPTIPYIQPLVYYFKK